jgi:hypothetical protein
MIIFGRMNRLDIVRAALRRKAPSPLGAVVRGMVAGAAGAGAQSLFFLATRKWAPEPTKLPRALQKPEPEAQEESSLQTVARRAVQDLMRRGPVSDAGKARAGSVVHYLFGAMWGGVYGLCRESFRTSSLLFGAGVWLASDNLILPAFRVAAWPQHYSLKEHHYALQAHFAYGLSTAAAYAVLRDLGPLPVSTVPAMLALQAWAWLLRTPPMRLVTRARPLPTRLLRNALVQKAALA